MAEMTPIDQALVCAGMHGEEYYPGVPVVHAIQTNPPTQGNTKFTAEILNPQAVDRGVRCVDENLSICLGDPSKYAGTYEGGLVEGIDRNCIDKDLIADLHSQQFVEKDYAYVGSRFRHYLLGLIAMAGIRDVLVSDNGLQGKFPQACLLDIAPGSHGNCTEFWMKTFARVSREGLDSPPLEEFNFYSHADLTIEDYEAAGLKRGVAYAPQEVLPGMDALFDTHEPVKAVYGCDKYFDGLLEVVVPLSHSSLTNENGVIHAPSLRKIEAV
jgi:hypothetical protein